MERADAEKKLRSLGLRVGLDTVATAVQQLQNGGSLYSLYTQVPRWLSKVTARKIRDLLNAGKLNFVLDTEELPRDLMRSIAKAAALTVAESEQGMMSLDDIRKAPRRPESLRARFEEISPLLPRVRWDIGYLKRLGVPVEVGLQLLVEHDLLERQIADADWPYRTLQRFVALHYIVVYYLQADNPPHSVIDLAAMQYSRGLIDRNLFLRRAGEGIVRYQVWQGPQYLEAFVQAQEPTLRERARLEALEQEIEEKMAPIIAKDKEQAARSASFEAIRQEFDQKMEEVSETERRFHEETDEQAKLSIRAQWRERLDELDEITKEMNAHFGSEGKAELSEEDNNGEAQA